MPAEVQRILFADGQPAVGVVRAEELLHHREGLGVCHDDGGGIGVHELLNIGGMIRLHVLHDQVIRRSAAERSLQVVQPFVGELGVHRVKHGDFFIEDHIGVVRHPVGDDVLPFKQIQLVIVDANVADVVGNVHKSHLSFPVLYFSAVYGKIQTESMDKSEGLE